MRTLFTDEFDAFVQNVIAGRQSKIIERTKQTVKILPIFEEQLKKTHLVSGIDHIIICLVKNGRANMVLKVSAKKRRTRDEIDAVNKQKKLDDDHTTASSSSSQS